jgi:hypothetical protein
MRIFLLILIVGCSTLSLANYSTPGTGIKWNLDDLVTNSSGVVSFSGGEYFINDTLVISQSDTVSITTNATIRLAQNVLVNSFGILKITPPDSVKITAQDTVQKFLGLIFQENSDASALKKIIFEYGNAIRLLDCDMLIDSCIIRYNTQVSTFASGAISLFRSNAMISNNKIYGNRRAAIQSGANIASSPKILNNLIYGNNTENGNYPQINFGATANDTMIIRGNIITSPSVMAGGISFLPIGSIPYVIIEDNIITHNRYGIAIQGGNSNFYINNNIIDSNNIQNIPLQGGSGINFNGTATQRSIVTRNKIRGNLWGITIQNAAKPNFGDLKSSDTTDAGLNEFYWNGNSGNIYDLYNNTPDSIKAENNWWGTDNLDSVEAHIFHKPDDPSLGFVDYLPTWIMTNVTSSTEFIPAYKLYDAYHNPFNPVTTISFDLPVNTHVDLSIFDVSGKLIERILSNELTAGSYKIIWNASGFSSGVYFVRFESGSFKMSRKLLLVK